MHKLLLISVLLVFTLCGSYLVAGILLKDRPAYSQVVVFGDSFSGNGNTFRLSKDTYPLKQVYFLGRFSDGPVWSEYFAQLLGVNPKDPNRFRNYAYGEAQVIGPVELQSIKHNKRFSFVVPDLSQEIDQYLNDGVGDVDSTLYIFFMGTNDILNTRLTPQMDNDKFAHALVTEEMKQIHRIEALGGKHILLVNIRDLTNTPYAHQQALNYSTQNHNATKQDYLRALDKLNKTINQKYAAAIAHNPNITLFDAYRFDNELMSLISHGGYPYEMYGRKYFLLHSSHGCYTGRGNYVTQNSTACSDPQNYFYYDRVHPTTFVHHIMAQEVYSHMLSGKKN